MKPAANLPEESPELPLKLKVLSACPLCGCDARSRQYALAQTSVFRCKACGLGYLDPCLDPEGMAQIYESSDSLKSLHDFHEGYYEYGSLEEDSKTLREFQHSLDAVECRVQGAQKKIFEVGYGNGLFLALARKRGWIVDGIDTSPQNLKAAKERFDLELKVGFFEGMTSSLGGWDAVALMDVIEHISEPYLILKKAHEILRPGGILLIGTPNQSSFFAKLAHTVWLLSGGRLRSGIDKIYFLEHVAYYDKRTLALLLNKAGFQPLQSFYAETDLAKYHLKPIERFIGEFILFFGRVFNSGNRLIMVAQKKE
ncbi:MAG: class I SAM-dependent methyltransferase [Candidatus Omnitrophica bacterium]|jgi:SAM-dependent methyltransferase|nr:class I SAM-dependent methyltransferase [Candidatus Omnitrophota bacterium]